MNDEQQSSLGDFFNRIGDNSTQQCPSKNYSKWRMSHASQVENFIKQSCKTLKKVKKVLALILFISYRILDKFLLWPKSSFSRKFLHNNCECLERTKL